MAGGDLVCKLPDPAKVDLGEALERIRYFAQNPIGRPAVGGLEVVCESRGGPATGFVMRHIVHALDLSNYLDAASRRQAGIRMGLPELVRLAARVSEGLAVFHARRVVMGDLHDRQILVDRGGEVHFLEPDSWELGLRIGGAYKWLRSGVGMYEYAPPEHQGVPFPTLDRSVASDRWALAVIVWRLIKGGAYPHQVRSVSIRTAYPTDLVRDRLFPHDPRATLPAGISPVDDPPTFRSLPGPLQVLFPRCFGAGAHNPAERPAPEEWAEALDDYTTEAGRASSPWSWPSRRSLGRVALAATTTALLLGGASWLTQAFESRPAGAPTPASTDAWEDPAVTDRPPPPLPTPFRAPPPLWRDEEP